MRSWLPHPALSVVILLLWAALNNAVSPGTLLLGAALGLALPLLTRRFWPDAPRLRRPGVALRLAARVASDIVVANLGVARRVLGPLSRLQPAFVEVPLDLADPFVATILASIVSLTPGTVSIDVDRTRRVLSLHALDAPDPQALAAGIKARYEAPLKEIFAC
ncbi:MAG: Na+/H+ antiporter subunit E [Rhodocyclaceae bacterium]|jgi:multicomponent K+:H+ antiporter subunit E